MTKGLSIACIDPGGTTGLWWGCFGIRELRQGPWQAMESAFADKRMMFEQIDSDRTGEREAAMQIYCWLELCNGETKRRTKGKLQGLDVVVFEDFILLEHTQKRDLLSPIRIAERVDQLLYANGKGELVGKAQAASQMKTVITKKRMKRHGFVWSYARRHEWDAFRHGALYLRGYCNKL